MRFISNIFSKNPVVKKDKLSGGYIAYYKKGEVIAQGSTQEEALHNLKEDIDAVNTFKKGINADREYSSKANRFIAHS
jgi:hypothetical protein